MKKSHALQSSFFLSTLLLLIWFPEAHLALVLLNFGVHLLVLGAQLVSSWFSSRSSPPPEEIAEEPFVSILVPAHNEPPEVLRRTLLSLARLRWSAFEVIVVDNNTSDESIWQPVERLCKKLGSRFRFFHLEGISGAKAGALNRIIPEIRQGTEFVFVVDADYVVERDALRRAVGRAMSPEVGLVQFPQEYRNVGPGNFGIILDYRHFFAGYMNVAQRLGAVPCTGTLSLIRTRALKEVGGFNPGVVTEDADLGLRLNSSGWSSIYVDEVVGRGLIPHDLESLKKQRWRWAFGNAQILKLNWKRFLLGGQLQASQRLGYLLHLTAWFNFNLIPSLSLVLLAPAVVFGMTNSSQPFIVVWAGFTLISYLVMRFGTFFNSLRNEGYGSGKICRAFLIHLGLGWIFGASWLKCLWNHHSPFIRTNKFLGGRGPGFLAETFIETSLGSLLLVSAVLFTTADFVLGPLGALAMAGARFLVHLVGWQTRVTRKITEELARVAPPVVSLD